MAQILGGVVVAGFGVFFLSLQLRYYARRAVVRKGSARLFWPWLPFVTEGLLIVFGLAMIYRGFVD